MKTGTVVGRCLALLGFCVSGLFVGAAEQVWNDAGTDNIWSTNAANWADGAVWTNGNSAVFSGAGGTLAGETIDLAATVTVANITFLTNNYVIADTNLDGSLSFVGGPSVITVANTTDVAKVSAPIRGGGFTKTGPGVLQLAADNAFTGVVRVSQGTLKLSYNCRDALGSTGAGQETIVENGATLDINGAYTTLVNRAESITLSGAGVNGQGALINTGVGGSNSGLTGTTTLLGDTTIGCLSRIDLRGNLIGNNYTLTKGGNSEFAVNVEVNNCKIVINAGQYTYMNNKALGTNDFDTTLAGTGALRTYGPYTVTERLICNGGGLVSAGWVAGQLFNVAGYVTLNSNVFVNTEGSCELELSGYLTGPGGLLRQSGSGKVYVTGNTNTFSGPTVVSGSVPLWVGKTVGGPGRLGSGVVTNFGNLVANSAYLGSGTLVNETAGKLYCNPPLFDSGRIINKGTLYGTSVLQVAGGILNSGTLNTYSGSLGDGAVTNSGTVNIYTNVFTYGQLVNSGTLNFWKAMTLTTPATFNGGTVYNADPSNTLLLAGAIMVSSNVTFSTAAGTFVEVSGPISGAGGVTWSGDTICYVTCTSNTLSGPTTVAAGKSLWVGKTVGGTETLGSGVVTNNGTLHANSTLLSTGDIVNNGTLYCNAEQLESGRIINAGTLYGYSRLLTTNVVNSGTLNTYSGVVGTGVVNNSGTVNICTNLFTFGRLVSSGTLNFSNELSVAEPMTLSGGTVRVGGTSNTLTLAGPITMSGNVTLTTASSTSGVLVAGYVSGAGGFTQAGPGWCHVTCDTNTFSGAVTINSGRALFVGETNLYSGTLGSATVTNNGTLYAYSSLITKGSLVNNGTLNSYTGLLCTGSVANNGNLYFSRGDALTFTNAFSGWGTIFMLYGPALTFNGSASTNSGLRLGAGTFTLTNNAFFRFTGEIQAGDRYAYSVDPTNATGIINVSDGCTLMAQAITFGNGNPSVTGDSITGLLNQTGGTVNTTGLDGGGEGNGIRLGHYPHAYCVYSMMGGTLIVGANGDLGCATDGQGWFKMTGGEVFAKRVMLNEREAANGFGRLSVSGGVMNLGSATGSLLANANGITADRTAPYFVELGGAGPIIRAVTNIEIGVSNTLYGVGAAAVTFDTQAWTISMTNRISGSGGFNKAGGGVLLLGCPGSSYSGATAVSAGTLKLGVSNAITNTAVTVAAGAALDLGGVSQTLKGIGGKGVVSNGTLSVSGPVTPGDADGGTLTLALATIAPEGTMTVHVKADGTCSGLQVAGDVSLSGMSLQVANPDQLTRGMHYTVLSWGGGLSGRFTANNLPEPWYVYYDTDAKEVQLRSEVGTIIRLR